VTPREHRRKPDPQSLAQKLRKRLWRPLLIDSEPD
jgi:hypothetical protein